LEKPKLIGKKAERSGCKIARKEFKKAEKADIILNKIVK
jgi:hypothetical protein